MVTEEIPDNQKRQNWHAPGYAVADESPVAQITWNDAVAYCNWLSEQEKLEPGYRADVDSWLILPGKNGYRLPTEAEWEYVCRAGTTTPYSFGDDVALLEQYGWYYKNAGDRSHAVGTLLPNGFGLYDMYGNLYEWCQDYWDEKWYEKTSSNDPNGPFSGSNRVLRGGSWNFSTSSCRSASRGLDSPSSRHGSFGFRCVRVVDAQGTTAPLAAPATLTKPIANINDPAFQAWMKTVAALPAEKQIEAVSKKLVELNPGFDGKLRPQIEDDMVTELAFYTNDVTDISPVRALRKLTLLGCNSATDKGRLSDLSPLEGMPLTSLHFAGTKVSDLSPLRGMKLTFLEFSRTQVSDLSPLKNMPLTWLELFDCKQVSDLSPLKDLPLDYLGLFVCRQVRDLTPLVGMPLKHLDLGGCAQVQDLTPLRGMKLGTLNLQGTRVRDLSLLKGMPLTELGLWGCDEISDLTQLRGLKLTGLNIGCCSQVRDLTPLVGMPLNNLDCVDTKVSDLSPLQGMPLKTLNIKGCEKIVDVTPLKDLPLIEIICDFKPERDAKILRAIKTLEEINDKKVEQFWMDSEKGLGDKPGVAPPTAAARAGFVPLFNGKDLTGWKPHPNQPGNWRVENGVLIGSGSASHLFSDRDDYKDIHLRVEARINSGGNSGVFFRTQFGPAFPAGYKAQINSTHKDPYKTGSLYMHGGPTIGVGPSPVPPNQWFLLEVIASGNHIVISVNGKTVTDHTDDARRFTTGHIALQQHDPETVVEFRKIEIKELPNAQAVGGASSKPDPIGERLAKAKATYQDNLEKLKDGLLKLLDKKDSAARATGDKALLDKIQRERLELTANGTISTVLPSGAYVRQLRSAARSFGISVRLSDPGLYQGQAR